MKTILTILILGKDVLFAELFTICLRLAKHFFSGRRNGSGQPLRGSDGTCKVSADT